MSKEKKEMSFLQHLESLRWHMARSAAVVMGIAGVLFYYKDFVFNEVIFGPMHNDFLTYRGICWISHSTGLGDMLCMQGMSFELVNLSLSGQFTTHIWTSVIGGVVAGAPYVLWEIWRFVRPALHEKERRYTTGVVLYASLLFIMGVLFSYYVVVPMTINFLGNYQVSGLVRNTISMDSYISTVTILSLIMGLVFELPILIFFLTRIGMVGSAFMRKYRKHAVVVILVIAALITPTSDIPTLIIVSAPLFILYEASIFVSRYAERKNPV